MVVFDLRTPSRQLVSLVWCGLWLRLQPNDSTTYTRGREAMSARTSKVDHAMAGIRQRPSCGHAMLVECPLSARDWEEVFFAMMAFRGVCRSVSERAHRRAEEGKR
jgi:hypothetical protein